MKTSKQKIEELFTLKPSRAVDIIFSENKIDQIHELYAALQQSQNKKMNTIALKQTLQNNYEKMLYCSELLDQVKKYSEAVKEVAAVIESHTDGVERKQKRDNINDQNTVTRIEGLVRKYRFSQAMAESFQNSNSLTNSEKYYMNYLRIQIIQKMERHICLNRLDKSLIEEYARCLEELLFEKSHTSIKTRGHVQELIKDFDEKSLLFLANKRVQRLNGAQSKKELQAIIYQILFEYKLGKIKNKFKGDHNSNYFEQYFEELATILKLYKSMKVESGEGRNLSIIFYQCTAQIKSQLSSIFIFRQQSDQIAFKCELYEQLISSPRFESIMNSFYDEIKQGNQQVQNPLTFIKELWHSYFINLVDLQLELAHPLMRLSSLKQHALNYENIPDELKIYLHDYSLEQSLHIIAEYQEKLKVLIKNLTPIIQKCTPSELISFTQKFNSKLQEICRKCAQSTAQLEEERTTMGLRKLILMKVLVHMLVDQIIKLNKQYNLGLEERETILHVVIKNPGPYWQSFNGKFRAQDSFSDAIIEFDRFFVGYVQGVEQHLKETMASVLQQISIIILTHIHEQYTGKHQGMLSHTIASLKQKKEKVTILDTIAVPYLAKNIFQCVMKPVCLDQQFYSEHFVCKPNKPAQKPVEMEVDEFQIGQKQQKQELVKAKIGKSIMNIGNNLITGFMKKKDQFKQ